MIGVIELMSNGRRHSNAKISIIGVGSASFGISILGSLFRSKKLKRCEIELVDINKNNLSRMTQLAHLLNNKMEANITITSTPDLTSAFDGADFVISAIEVPPREILWRQDFEITLKYGVRQPYAENGGPGGFIHAARNIGPVLEIVRHMEKVCPDALFINFSNPMVRICDAVNRFSTIKVVGLCHQINAAYGMVGFLLSEEFNIALPDGPFSTHADPKFWGNLKHVARQAKEMIDIKAAGLNHFTWILGIYDKKSGKDLYPTLRDAWDKCEIGFEPLTHKVYDIFGLMPVPGDEHLDEYLPWCSDPVTKPWEKYGLSLYNWDKAAHRRNDTALHIEKVIRGEDKIDSILDADSEGAIEVIESIAFNARDYHEAVNVPNKGQISNLPNGVIVETPAYINGSGIQPINIGELPVGIIELLKREISVGQLCVDSVVTGDRNLALQCLLLDPVITDLDVAKLILDDYLETYKDMLPNFW